MIKRLKKGSEYQLTPLVENFKCEVLEDKKCVKITWTNLTPERVVKRVFRKNNENGIKYITATDDFTFIGSTDKELGIDGSTTTHSQIIDWTIGNSQTVHYQIEDGQSTNYLYSYSEPVTTNWEGWSIIGLTPVDSDSVTNPIPTYNAGEVWNFICDVDSGQISRNINPTVHVGTSSYAQTSRENTKYESGTFTASLLSLECPSLEIIDDIQRVKRWMKFISETDRFLLKSHKGDVWVISISGNPQRSYEESTLQTLTTISYEWVEVEDVNNIIVR